MTRSILLAALAVSVAAPMPVLAAGKDTNRDDQVVCRRDREANLGSHIRAPRTCRTRAEWREIEDHTQRELTQVQDGRQPMEPEGSTLVPGPGGGPS